MSVRRQRATLCISAYVFPIEKFAKKKMFRDEVVYVLAFPGVTPPLTERIGPWNELRLIRCESRKSTITVISSWKCLLTPRSIFCRSEYLISLFFAASCNAALTNFLATPWKRREDKHLGSTIGSYFKMAFG